MIRTSLLVPLACALLLRDTLCSCDVDDGPCEYEVTPLAPDDETPWGTTPAQDLAELEVPQHGTWTWSESEDFIEIQHAGVSVPAWATFVHDPETISFSEHIGGGYPPACKGPIVSADGTLTFTDEQGGVIVSVPVTVERQLTATLNYGSSPVYSPISQFSTAVQTTADFQFQLMQVNGSIIWLDDGLLAEFYYFALSMRTETTGDGVTALIAKFEADTRP